MGEGLVLMLKKQDIGINPHIANNGSKDQFLTGIGGPQVYLTLILLSTPGLKFSLLPDSALVVGKLCHVT